MRVTLCDRCGGTTDFGLSFSTSGKNGTIAHADLCVGCMSDLDGWVTCPPPGSRREKELSLGALPHQAAAVPHISGVPGAAGQALAALIIASAAQSEPQQSDAEFLAEQSAAVFAAAEAIGKPFVTPTLTPDPPLSPKAEAAHAEIIEAGEEKTRKPKGVPKGEPIPLYVYPGEVEGACSRAACGMGGPLVADGCKYEVVVGDKRATFTATNVGDVPHMHARAAAFVAASGIPADEWRRDGDLTYSVPLPTFRAKYAGVK